MKVRVKALTPFNEPVYKDVEVVKRVPEVDSKTAVNIVIGVVVLLFVLGAAWLAYKHCFANFEAEKSRYGHERMAQDTSMGSARGH